MELIMTPDQLAPVSSSPALRALTNPEQKLERLYDLVLGERPATRKAYASCLRDFAGFLMHHGLLPLGSDGRSACLFFVGAGVDVAQELADQYRKGMIEGKGFHVRTMAPSTIDQRLSALSRVVKIARRQRLISWTIELDRVTSEAYRDMSGPSMDDFALMLAEIDGDSPQDYRDRAILLLLGAAGLRRAEVRSIDMQDLDLNRPDPRVRVLQKRRIVKQWVEIPTVAAEAVQNWAGLRCSTEGPLFIRLDGRAPKDPPRISLESIWHIVRRIGRRAGLGTVRPHGLRHMFVTTALDLSNGNVQAVQAASRHSDPRVVQKYDDKRHKRARNVMELVGRAVASKREEKTYEYAAL
jgi:integrase